mmetsp:Transcript_28912/g.44457  ORF Transcript_28912/g.44457 Transcript_28912/m.44457 type:complete len:200 (+) Transcript_28912:348-947(+)
MIQEADATNDLSSGLDLVRGEVGRISDHHGRLGHLISGLDTHRLPVFVQNLFDILVEHKRSSVNGANSGKSFRQASQTVNRINVRRCSVATEGIAIRLEFLDGTQGGLVHVGLVELQTHGVTDELVGIGLHSKVRVKLAHGHLGQITTLVRLRIFRDVLINEQQEFAKAALLKESHKRTHQGFFRSGGNLENLASLVNV